MGAVTESPRGELSVRGLWCFCFISPLVSHSPDTRQPIIPWHSERRVAMIGASLVTYIVALL